jgi:hypothetical protein
MFPVTLAVKMKGFALAGGREVGVESDPGVHLAVFEMWVSAVEGAHATTVPFRKQAAEDSGYRCCRTPTSRKSRDVGHPLLLREATRKRRLG